jgi:CubicO group peptidase (beta-lactamase class C family)
LTSRATRLLIGLTLGFSLGLGACGGGGSSGSPDIGGQPPPDPPPPEPPPDAQWEDVRNALDNSDIDDLTLIIGTAEGQVFEHQKGTSTKDTVYELASGSKLLASAAIMALVDKRIVSLDDHPQDYISWWDTTGARSRITLQQLLSFTSGFSGTAIDVRCVEDPNITLEDCAKDIHDNFFVFEPGRVFYYGPSHLQVAGFMVEQATGQSWNDIFFDNVVAPLALTETRYVKASDANPRIAGGAVSTGREYSRVLQALLAGELRQQSFPYMRTDRTDDGVEIAESFFVSQLGYEWHYAFGQWRECRDAEWSDACRARIIVSSGGAYGWYPWIDIDKGYYGVLATERPITIDDRPAIDSIALVDAIRPLIESVLPATVSAGPTERMSTAGESYADPEILTSEAKITFQDKSGTVWVGDLDPQTGLFASPTGRDILLDSGAESLLVTFNGPEFGVDADGWSVFYSKRQGGGTVQVWRAEVDGDQVSSAPLTSGMSQMTALPSRNPMADTTRLLSILGDWDAGTLVWLDEREPELMNEFGVVDTRDTTHPTWVWDTNAILFSRRSGVEFGQLALLDTQIGNETTVTKDAGDKTLPVGWLAPDYGGDLLVLALVDKTEIAVYRDAGEPNVQRIATLGIPTVSSGVTVGSAEPFVANGKSYISLAIQNNESQLPGVADAEIWIFDLDDNPETRFALRCDDGLPSPVMRIDPETFVGRDQVFVYYNVFTAQGNFEVFRCATGIKTR